MVVQANFELKESPLNKTDYNLFEEPVQSIQDFTSAEIRKATSKPRHDSAFTTGSNQRWASTLQKRPSSNIRNRMNTDRMQGIKST